MLALLLALLQRKLQKCAYYIHLACLTITVSAVPRRDLLEKKELMNFDNVELYCNLHITALTEVGNIIRP